MPKRRKAASTHSGKFAKKSKREVSLQLDEVDEIERKEDNNNDTNDAANDVPVTIHASGDELGPSNNAIFQTHGFLTAKETVTEITDRDGKSLSTKGSFLNEAIVDISVGNLQSIRRLQHVQILTTTTFTYWKNRAGSDLGLKNPSDLRSKLKCNTLQAIASPIYSPNHWTLIIVINRKFVSNQDNVDGAEWRVLYFDSLNSSDHDRKYVLEFSRWLLELKSNETPDFVIVPTPKQSAGSNDCGLLAAHYLRVFLREFAVNFKAYSSDVIPNLSEEALNDAWEYSRFPRLRKQALDLFNYKKELHSIFHKPDL